jgi:hypothetical protein
VNLLDWNALLVKSWEAATAEYKAGIAASKEAATASQAAEIYCACYPGMCHGGEVINGKTACGAICKLVQAEKGEGA